MGITEKQLMLILGHKTCSELRNWFYKYGTHKWLKEHKELKLAR